MLGVVSAFHPALGRRHDALAGGAGRHPGAVLGRQHLDARRLPPHLHAGDQPPDPQLARQARPAHGDPLRGDRDQRRDRARPGRSRPTSSCWPASTPSGRPWRSRSPTSRSSACGSRTPTGGGRSGSRSGSPGAAPSCRCRRSSPRSSAASPSSASSPTTRPRAGSALGWMAFGLIFYVVYRKVFEGTTLTKRVSVTERALTKQVPEVEFRNILVPVFGTKFDDDIVATAGRLAAAEQAESEATRTTLAARRRLRDRGAADPAARREAAAGARGGGAAGAGAGARGRGGVRGRRASAPR